MPLHERPVAGACSRTANEKAFASRWAPTGTGLAILLASALSARAFLGSGAAPSAPHPSKGDRAAPGTEKVAPRLAVLISVDQLRGDYLKRFAPLFTGGFHRLLQ